MANLGKFGFGGGHKGRKHNRSNFSSRSDRKFMLDAGKLNLFHFDLDDELSKIANQEAVGFLKGNITIKANNSGIDDTKDYLDRLVDEKVITPQESRSIARLLERYGKWR